MVAVQVGVGCIVEDLLVEYNVLSEACAVPIGSHWWGMYVGVHSHLGRQVFSKRVSQLHVSFHRLSFTVNCSG